MLCGCTGSHEGIGGDEVLAAEQTVREVPGRTRRGNCQDPGLRRGLQEVAKRELCPWVRVGA